VLGDRHYNTPELRENCDQADRLLVTTRMDAILTPAMVSKCDASSICSVRLRWKIFMSISKVSLMGMDKFPTCGLIASQRFALGAIFVYQLALLYRFERDLELCVGLKAFLKAAY
jgi:hypothetical protein